MAKQKQLRLWNGPFLDRKHCYVAAYSVADANKIMMQAAGRQHGSFASYIREYFSECWGTPMAGIIPERGLWAKSSSDRVPQRLV
jgi:hypothetical protein